MKEKNKYSPWLLSGIGFLFLLASYLWIPFLSFLSLIPFLALFDYFHRKGKSEVQTFVLHTLLPFVFSYLVIGLFHPLEIGLLRAFVHGIIMASTLYFFWFTQTFAKNRLGFLTVLIYWLALEYVSMEWLNNNALLLLGATLEEQTTLIRWTSWTGYIGVTAWIILSNLILYTTVIGKVLHGRKINRPFFFCGIILILIPAFLSWFIFTSEQSLTTLQVNMHFSGFTQMNATVPVRYQQSGEYFGRTALWVSILLVMYSFVHKKITR